MAARPRKAKHRNEPQSAAATLDELESAGDRLVAWIGENAVPIGGALAAVLVLAAIVGIFQGTRESSREEASAALAKIDSDFRLAMGARPEDVIVAEPANPEIARDVRTEYAAKYREVAEEYGGTAAASVALLEAGGLEQALGRPEEALATWQQAEAELGNDQPLKALLLIRIAASHEAEGRWLEAGESYERAAGVFAYPLRHQALGDAARCFAEAGDAERALAAYDRIETEAPDVVLPEHVDATLRELRVSRTLQ